MIRRLLFACIAVVVVSEAAGAQESAALVEEGRRAFVRNGCHDCHTVGRMGTPVARDLTRVGAKYDAPYIARWLRDPGHIRPSTHMPGLELTDSDIEALAAFLAAQR
ncbi:MAG TPA: cytochrome c [Methylomirabilota bacterium]|jgi:mono/diheme cytochrome c family protein